MKQLMNKEIKLALHSTSFIFMALSAMLLIPNYPYYVIFFYTGLSIFFTCLNGRENNDIFYTMLLPVKKEGIVSARIMVVVILQIMQILIGIPFAVIRQSFSMTNAAGMDANIGLFAMSFLMLGLFNYVFFTNYYKDVKKVGTAFIKASTVTCIYIGLVETLVHVLPFFKNKIDTKDPDFLIEKLILLIFGIILYALLTLGAYKKSKKLFVVQDI